MDENELATIENELLSSEQYLLFRRFGTFQILFPHGTREMWLDFQKRPLEEIFKRILPTRPISICFILCRRHPEITSFFLQYFDDFQQDRIELKDYIFFLMYRVEYIPVQWIAYHIVRIQDLRYSIRVISSVFSYSMRHVPYCSEQMNFNNQVWMEFIKNHPELSFENQSVSWKKLLSYRSAISEIIGLKLPVKLEEYLAINKSEFVKNLITNAKSSQELQTILKTQLIHYCERHLIDFVPSLISIVTKKDWILQQKLGFIIEYIHNPKDRKKAVDEMTVHNEQELQQLKEFADKYSIDFNQRTKQITSKINVSCSGPITRSNSIGEFKPRPRAVGKRQDKCKRSPSIDLSNVKNFGEQGSVNYIANGEPNDPVEYANKLRRLRSMKEIKPLYDLAQNFGMVVSYDEFSMFCGKRQIFDRLITDAGTDRFDEICSTLQLTDDEIIDYICTPTDYICLADKILAKLEKHVSPTNFCFFFSYLQNYATEMLNKDPISLILKLYKSGIEVSLRNATAATLLFYSTSLKYVNLIYSKNVDEAEQLALFEKLISDEKLIEASFARDEVYEDKNAFVAGYLSPDLNEFANSITFISMLQDLKQKEDYLLTVLPQIDGTKYSLLEFVFMQLQLINPIYDSDMTILNQLSLLSNEKINFHRLKAQPIQVFTESVTPNNVFDLLPLTEIFNIPSDDLLLFLMQHKMTSTKFEDYRLIMNKLKDRSSKPQLMQIIHRFSVHDQIVFLNSFIKFHLEQEKQTLIDMIRMNLTEYVQDEFISVPSLIISTIYSKLILQEKFGDRLHIFAQKVAERFNLDLFKIQTGVVVQFLTSEIGDSDDLSRQSSARSPRNKSAYNLFAYKQPSTGSMGKLADSAGYVEDEGIFQIQNEPQNLQCALFIIRNWDKEVAVDWLTKYVSNCDNSWSSRSLALQCLFSITDGDIPKEYDIPQFYFKAMLESTNFKFGDRITDDYLFELLNKLIKEKEAKTIVDNDASSSQNLRLDLGYVDEITDLSIRLLTVARLLFEYFIVYRIYEPDKAIQAMTIILADDPLFIIKNIIRLMMQVPAYINNDEINEIAKRAVSAPLDLIVRKVVHWQSTRPHHMAVMRDVFNLISLIPKPIDYLIIDNKKIGWGELAQMLCSVGSISLAAELGAHLVRIQDRNKVLYHLMMGSHFDEALKYGFDRDKIFSYIVKGHISQATQTLVDAHFVMFTAWLQENNDEQSLKEVENSLIAQGRTKEIERMKGRLAKMSPK